MMWHGLTPTLTEYSQIMYIPKITAEALSRVKMVWQMLNCWCYLPAVMEHLLTSKLLREGEDSSSSGCCPQQCTMQLFIQRRILDSQRCGPQQKPNVTTLGKCENRAIKYGMQAFIFREAHFFSFSAHFMDCKAFGPTTIWKGQMLRN